MPTGPAVRAGGGPVFLEAVTYRWHGHYEGDPERYRSPTSCATGTSAPAGLIRGG